MFQFTVRVCMTLSYLYLLEYRKYRKAEYSSIIFYVTLKSVLQAMHSYRINSKQHIFFYIKVSHSLCFKFTAHIFLYIYVYSKDKFLLFNNTTFTKKKISKINNQLRFVGNSIFVRVIVGSKIYQYLYSLKIY